jgi:hypothetical protein
MAYERTKVRATNPAKGVYRTLDGRFEIRQAEKAGTWDVFQLLAGGAQRVASAVKGYDRALDRILEEPGIELEALNTRPAKPKAEAPKVEKDETDRRSGATGEAPKAQPKGGRPHVNRGGRKVA